MARRRRRRKDGSPWAILGIVGLLGFVICAIGLFFVLKMRATEAAGVDEDLCPAGGPVSVTAMLLDMTDPISEITQVDLRRQFQRAVSEVEKGGLIEVYALTGDEGKLRRTFRGCNPGDGASADPWTSNPRKIQARWDKAFNEPLKQISASIGGADESAKSPIMAGIQRIVIESLSDPRADNSRKRLYVASDMMENTDAFSIYKSGADYAAFLKSAGRDRFRTPLDLVEVKFWSFQRDASSKHAKLPEFWATWVEANHGSFIGYERLSGIR